MAGKKFRGPDIADVREELARSAADICLRLYGTTGYFRGKFYIIGDTDGNPGQSLHVHVDGRKAGLWWDESTGQHGSMIDLIMMARGCSFADAIPLALHLLRKGPVDLPEADRPTYKNSTTVESAAKFYHASNADIRRTLAEVYLNSRGIFLPYWGALRFHPSAYRKIGTETFKFPAMVAPITNTADEIIGVGRYLLDDDGKDVRRSLGEPKTIMGRFHGHGVKFGPIRPFWCIGEGLENTLSAKMAVHSSYSFQACLTAGSMESVEVPLGVKKLVAFMDKGSRAELAFENMGKRFREERPEIELLPVWPMLDDFNDDLRELGFDILRDNILEQYGFLAEPA